MVLGGLTLYLSALQSLNLLLVENFVAARPRGSPSVVTARLECIWIPQTT